MIKELCFKREVLEEISNKLLDVYNNLDDILYELNKCEADIVRKNMVDICYCINKLGVKFVFQQVEK